MIKGLRLRDRINLSVAALLLVFGIPIIVTGYLVISDIIEQLHARSFDSRLQEMVLEVDVAHADLSDAGIADIEAYVRSAQQEVLGRLRDYSFGDSEHVHVLDSQLRELLSRPSDELELTDAAQRALVSSETEGQFWFSHAGTAYLATFRKTHHWDWTLLLVMDRAEYFAPRRLYSVIVAAISLLVFALVFLLSSRVVRNHGARVEGILEGLRRMAAGEHSLRLVEGESDELGSISRELNHLIQQIEDEIAHRKRSESDLTEATRQAEEANRTKSEFLANISHELRTPLNAILGMSHLALDPKTPADKREQQIEQVRRSAEFLLRVINDILDFSRIEAGKLELEQVPFRLDEILAQLDGMVAADRKQKEITLAFDVDQKIPQWLLGDPQRLGQVLLNLVGNAIKFSVDHDEIRVGVRRVKSDDPGVQLHFSVTDHGVGMSEQQQARLFQAFSLGDASSTRRHAGSGLGLAISERIVRLMSGCMWVKSELGAGSTFSFYVQLEEAQSRDGKNAAERGSADQLATAVEHLAGGKILLVEDNPINQELAREILIMQGLRVRVAENGQRALECLREESFDGVLMDCQMPDIDGYTATRLLREELGLRDLPVIALTANAMAGDRERALESGMNDYIAKPLRVAELMATLARWIHPAQGHEVEENPVQGGERNGAVFALPSFEHIDATTALEQLEENRGLYQRMLRRFLQNNLDAVSDIRSALTQGDIEVAIRQIHDLKSDAGIIGAWALQQESLEIESELRSGKVVGSESLERLARELGAVNGELIEVA